MPFHFLDSSSWLPIFMTTQFYSISLNYIKFRSLVWQCPSCGSTSSWMSSLSTCASGVSSSSRRNAPPSLSHSSWLYASLWASSSPSCTSRTLSLSGTGSAPCLSSLGRLCTQRCGTISESQKASLRRARRTEVCLGDPCRKVPGPGEGLAAISLWLMLNSPPPVLNHPRTREFSEGGGVSDFTWGHRPTFCGLCLETPQPWIRWVISVLFTTIFSTVLCYWIPSPQSYWFYIHGLGQDYPFCCCSDDSLP